MLEPTNGSFDLYSSIHLKVGNDGTSQYTFNWWDHVYNRASANLEIEKDGEVSKICPVHRMQPISRTQLRKDFRPRIAWGQNTR